MLTSRLGFFCAFLCIFIVVPSKVGAQSLNSFKDFSEKAASINVADTTDYSKKSLPSVLEDLQVVLFLKTNWLAQELVLVDSLVDYAGNYGSTLHQALIYYNAAFAYRDFDEEISDSLFRVSFHLFEKISDIDGQIFTLANLIDNTILLDNQDLEFSRFLKNQLNELFLLKEKTNWGKAHFRVLSSILSYKSTINEPLNEAYLDSIYAESMQAKPNSYKSNLFAALSGQYHRNNNKLKALLMAKNALQSLDSNDFDQPVYLYNLGWLYMDLNFNDSALFYLRLAYNAYPKMDIIYFVAHQSNTSYILAMVHKAMGNLDSAFFYMNESLVHSIKLSDLKLREKRIYAEKSYETAQVRAKLNEKELILRNQSLVITYYLVATVSGFVIFLVLLMLLKKRRTISLEAKKLAANREQLVQIISHDLTGSINALLTYVKIYDEAKLTLPPNEFKRLQNSFVSSATAIQTTLKNITQWGLGIRGKLDSEKRMIDVCVLVQETVNTYQAFATAQHIFITVNCQPQKIVALTSAMATLLRNLVTNAIKHGLPHTTVHLDCRQRNNCLHLSVTNACLPDDAAFLQSILQRLQNHSYQSVAGSLGMELICQALKRMNAKIDLKQLDAENICIEIDIPLNSQ